MIAFVSPQLWAWKKHRIKLVEKYIRRMLVIFPFEEQFYREHGVQAEFVGHPLAELPLPTISREEFAKNSGRTLLKRGSRFCPAAGPGKFATTCRICWRLRGLSRAIHAMHRTEAKQRMRAVCRGLERRPSREEGSFDQFEFVVPLAPTLNKTQQHAVLDMVDDRGLQTSGFQRMHAPRFSTPVLRL